MELRLNIKNKVCLFYVIFLAACAQSPVQTTDGTAKKVTRDYEGIGDATGIRPYIYGKHTLIKFDGGKPTFMSIKDEHGASVSYEVKAGYYVLDRKLDTFMVSGSGRTVRFNTIAHPKLIASDNNQISEEKQHESDVSLTSETDEKMALSAQKAELPDAIKMIMKEQLQYQRQLLDKASANPIYTGEELFQINSRLDAIESKIAMQNAVVHVYFPFESTVFNPDSKLMDALLPVTKDAVIVNLYGRTDSKVADDINTQIAKGRAEAAKSFLIEHGVPSDIIRTSWLAAGDFIASAGMEDGRKLNRRVTIEVITQ